MCGSTAAQNQIQSQQQGFYTQAVNQASQVFGQDSQVFSDLMNTFAPTVAAGPNQQGFSAGELSNMNSQAITQTGQAYKNARQAVGEQTAAQGGGNTALPGGATQGVNAQLATSAANQTSSELAGITQANYATGRQNYINAASGLSQATGAFNSATSAMGAATQAGEAASNTANQVAQENNSWVNSAIGALGGIAGAATGGLMGGGLGSLGGSNNTAGVVPSVNDGTYDPLGLNTGSSSNSAPPSVDTTGWANSGGGTSAMPIF